MASFKLTIVLRQSSTKNMCMYYICNIYIYTYIHIHLDLLTEWSMACFSNIKNFLRTPVSTAEARHCTVDSDEGLPGAANITKDCHWSYTFVGGIKLVSIYNVITYILKRFFYQTFVPFSWVNNVLSFLSFRHCPPVNSNWSCLAT